ncbi:MAG: beta-propeller fold lactonase family protein [Candidatus Binatia bacterium]|nr:beta-propeller fold lactonase family protein [Candidatus Binatia bacterium]
MRIILTLVIGLLAGLPADAATLSLVDSKTNGVGGVSGLEAPRHVIVSPDGAHVYVLSQGLDSTVVVFSRDGGTGVLSFVASYVEGVAFPVSPTLGAHTPSPDGSHYYIDTSGRSFRGRILRFSRDAVSG